MGYGKIEYYGRTLIDLTGDSVTPEKVLEGATYHNPAGDAARGTMPNRGAVSGTISTVAGEYAVPNGYHDGNGKVTISPAEQAKVIPGNIAEGVTILGVLGTYRTPYVTQEKTATPATSAQEITPDAGYVGLSKVTVNAVPYSEEDNSAGGITVTIG